MQDNCMLFYFRRVKGLLAIMFDLSFLVFVTTVLYCTSAHSEKTMNENSNSMETTTIHGNQDLEIPENDIQRLENEALSGSSDAAHRLSAFYGFVKLDFNKSTYWAQIEAENGSANGQYNYAFRLYKDPDPQKRLRARFWLELALKSGSTNAFRLLNEMDENERDKVR